MGLVPCRECGNQVSTKAYNCPKCGAPVTVAEPSRAGGCLPVFSFFMGVIATLVVIIFLPWQANKRSAQEPNGAASAPSPSEATEQPPGTDSEVPAAPLRLISSRLERENGEAVLRGEVRNVSAETLDHLMAAATFQDRDGATIKTESMLIKEPSLGPGGQSTFEVAVRDNPAIEKGEVAFKTPGGKSILHAGPE